MDSIDKKILGLISKGKTNTAIEKIEKLIEQKGENADLYMLLGLASIYLFNFTEAKIYLGKALTIDKINIPALQALAFIYLKEHRTDEAISNYLTIIEIDPKNKLAKQKLDMLKQYDNLERNIRQMHISDFVELVKGKSAIKENILILLIIIAIILLIVFIILKIS